MGGRTLFRDLTFTLTPGTRLGLLGLNGTGKTTLLRILNGELAPDAGRVEQAMALRTVYFDQTREQLDPSQSLRQGLGAHGDTVIFRDRPIHVAGWAKRFLFDSGQLDRPIASLSGGEQARVLIARLMLQPADLLLMDEPTNGLDPPQIHAMREVLRRYAATGRTVLVSSHLLSEVEQTCSHVVVVHLGTTIAAGTVAELVSSSGEMSFTVDDREAAARVLRTLAGDVEITENGVQADLGAVPAARAVAALVTAGVAVSSAAPRNRLEDVFLTLIGASGSGSDGASPDGAVGGSGRAPGDDPLPGPDGSMSRDQLTPVGTGPQQGGSA
jgi:ABC-type multidrug transport system ATPase subunit